MNSLLAPIFPMWEKDIPSLEYWLFHSITDDKNTTVYRNGLRVNLVIQKPGNGRILTLIVDAED